MTAELREEQAKNAKVSKERLEVERRATELEDSYEKLIQQSNADQS